MKECTRCGKCCMYYPCDIAAATIGSKRPCRALESADGVAVCGMVAHPSKYLDLGPEAEWKDDFLGGVFRKMLGIGLGCCTSPKTIEFAKELSEFHGRKVTVDDIVMEEIRRVEKANRKDFRK